jgi:hypothetical protein
MGNHDVYDTPQDREDDRIEILRERALVKMEETIRARDAADYTVGEILSLLSLSSDSLSYEYRLKGLKALIEKPPKK